MLFDAPPSDKKCFAYCGDDRCTCKAHPRHRGFVGQLFRNSIITTEEANAEIQRRKVKFHSGGIPTLAPGEVPAILSEGFDMQKDSKIDLLDHGYVRLVESMGNDLSIVRAARTSYDAAWRAGEDKNSDTRLINYLWKNHHTTPFEAVEFQFEVKAPIFVVRQWHRHRTWSYNELSARYRELPEEFYVPEAHLIGRQSFDNKQMRVLGDATPVYAEMVCNFINESNKEAFEVYRALLTEGCPRELARSVLPMGTYTHMFAKVDLKNLFDFLRLRTHEHAQYEIRVYAEAMLELIRPIVPVAVAAWEAAKAKDLERLKLVP